MFQIIFTKEYSINSFKINKIMKNKYLMLLICLLHLMVLNAFSQDVDLIKKLDGFDQYMAENLKNWNMPGVGVGIVKNGKLAFVKGYGYRDYEKKLPITANTLFQIASNTKLFTAMSVGMLVNEGKLEWDKPIRNYVPSIQFYNNELNSTVTVRDMLSHRTGISRHDMIWYKSNFNRTELFEKLKYLEPTQPLRQGYLYNNLMYAASGHIIDLIEGKKWEAYLQEKIFQPLDMKSTVFNIADMLKQPDYFVPYNEKRDTTILYKIPYLEDTDGMGPAGSIISNITDLSHWVIARMNNGKFNGKQVIPEAVISATLEPAMAYHNASLDRGWNEVMNPIYGMGCDVMAYRGHQIVMHGGDLNGIHSQISYMPQDSIGVIVFVIGDRNLSYNGLSFSIYERLLGMSLTPWSERGLKNKIAQKTNNREGRSKALVGQAKGTKPSHSLEDYSGDFENKTYGIVNISKKDSQLSFKFNKFSMPLNHFHYDRFDTPNDEEDGYFSLNYQTNPQGEVDRFNVTMEDSGELTFHKKVDTSLSTVETLSKYAGKYKIGNQIIKIMLKDKNRLYVSGVTEADLELLPYKSRIFKVKDFSESNVEFVLENGIVKSLKQKDPSGEYEIMKVVEGK